MMLVWRLLASREAHQGVQQGHLLSTRGNSGRVWVSLRTCTYSDICGAFDPVIEYCGIE